MDFSQVPSIVLLILGFGFVIFWHELGHFLAAKWAKVKVEQFAVGFGQALLAWRKGIGWKVGTTQPAYEKRIQEYREIKREAGEADPSELEAATALGLGETEYRLNWIPLGGYVKMLGQDDLNPTAESEDPRAYNRQTIAKRMVIVSAGVVMNIILAALGFMVLFLIGFNAPPAMVGAIVPGSPATHTVRADGTPEPLQIGDRILEMDGKYQHDFTKIMLNTALLEEGAKVPLLVQHPDGTKEQLYITPGRLKKDPRGLLMLGIMPPVSLNGPEDPRKKLPLEEMFTPGAMEVKQGETIAAVEGQAVKPNQFWVLARAVENSQGKPVQITIRGADGKTRQAEVQPHLTTAPREDLSFGGMLPRARVVEVMPDSPVLGKVMPGDVVLAADSAQDHISNPSLKALQDWLSNAGTNGRPVDLQLLRGNKVVEVKGITPNVKLENGKRGLAVVLSADELHPVVAGVAEESAAKAAKIPLGATIESIDGQDVHNWFDVKRILSAAKPGQAIAVTLKTESDEQVKRELTLSAEQIEDVASYRYASDLQLKELDEPRKTSNPLVAAKWGVIETRDFILQFYLTIKRMVQGSVSYTNMMGPVGIFRAGTRLAYKGTDWLLWFLSMISANLAVVNFLPIPIVDGGLFTFLIVEKVRGKPLSPYAQQVAQFVGLAVLLGVFLLVTYQDIMRPY